MKKSLFFLASAALVLASCNNDVKLDENTSLVTSNQPKEISFSPLNNTPKRAIKRAAGAAEYNAVENTDYPQNYNMKVVAYSIPESGTAGNYFGSATADGGILFKYQFAGGVSAPGVNANYWGGNPAQFWPLSPATLNFLAVSKGGSPTADVVSPQFNSNYASGVTVTLSDNKPQTAISGDGQHDLMYAFGRASVTKSGNALVFPTKVDMTFKHALAWVYFRIKAGNTASHAISIKGIKLNGAYYAGTFGAAVDHYDSSSDALAWNTSNTKWTAASAQSNDIYSPNYSAAYDTKGATGAASNDSKALTDGFVAVGDGILVVPTSEITPAETSLASFDIEYYMNGNLYTINYAPSVLTLEKGKKYIYDITMTLHEIYVNASVTNWEDGGTEFVDIPTVSTKHGEAASITANAAGTYTVYVTDLGASAAYTVTTTDGSSILAEAPATSGTADANGVAKISFKAKATAGANTATIVLTKTSDSSTTTITVNQE